MFLNLVSGSEIHSVVCCRPDHVRKHNRSTTDPGRAAKVLKVVAAAKVLWTSPCDGFCCHSGPDAS